MTQNEGGKLVQFPGQEVSKDAAPAEVTEPVTMEDGQKINTEPTEGAEPIRGADDPNQAPVTSGFSQVAGEVTPGEVETLGNGDAVRLSPAKQEAAPIPWAPKKGCFKYKTAQDIMKDAHLLRVAFLENGSAVIGMDALGRGLDHVLLITATRDQFYTRPVIQFSAPVYDELMAVETDQLLNYSVPARSIASIAPLNKWDIGGYLLDGYINQVLELWAKRITPALLQQEAAAADQKRLTMMESQRQQMYNQFKALPLPLQKEQLEAALRNLGQAKDKLDSMPPAQNPTEHMQQQQMKEEIARQIHDLGKLLRGVLVKLNPAPETDENSDHGPACGCQTGHAGVEGAAGSGQCPVGDPGPEGSPGIPAETNEAPAPGGGEK